MSFSQLEFNTGVLGRYQGKCYVSRVLTERYHLTGSVCSLGFPAKLVRRCEWFASARSHRISSVSAREVYGKCWGCYFVQEGTYPLEYVLQNSLSYQVLAMCPKKKMLKGKHSS